MADHPPSRPTFWQRLLRHVVGDSARISVVRRPQNDPRFRIYDFDFYSHDDMSYEQLSALQEGMGSVRVALSSQTLAALPAIEFKKQPLGAGERCTVCLEVYEDGERVLQLPCFHIFHGHCATHWLKTSKICPLCRGEVTIVKKRRNVEI